MKYSRFAQFSLVVGIFWTFFLPHLEAQSKPTPKTKRSKTASSPTIGEYRSKNFVVRTDLTPDEAKELLKRLDTMIGLVEKYFEKRLASPIGMIVVKDLNSWPREIVNQFDPDGLAKIEEGAGVTLSRTLSNSLTGQVLDAKAVVYSIADRGTPQHEAVHAYCALTFGRTGPTWYSEGMAEIGQYWTEKGLGVHCHEIVMKYLQSQPPKDLSEIVDVSDRTGDSWQNYAWRWVLCHMLANNPNYSPRFKPLGLGMLAGQDVSFESVYGSMAKEINFEYQFFLKHIDQGYRADLCAWDWKAKFTSCKGSTPFSAKVDANRGWQASRILVKADEEYDYLATGTWKTAADATPVSADGDAEGVGKLIGLIFDDYKLSEPFELGAYGSFKPPMDGSLLIRCQDKWNSLGDNTGKLQLKFKLTGRGNPFPKPESKDVVGSDESKTTTSKSSSVRKSNTKTSADD